VAVRLVIGRDADVIRETEDGLELHGRVRLRPGFVVEVAPRPGGRTARSMLVWTWRLRAVGSDGPIYRGLCRWHRPEGNGLPATFAGSARNAETGRATPGIDLDEFRDA
jgi:hypothetical protein